jgi:uncharacterized iron-regulated membrane protein
MPLGHYDDMFRTYLPLTTRGIPLVGGKGGEMDCNKLIAAVLVGTIAAGTLGVGSAYARNEREAAIIADAKISMVQAIAAAENQVGGKAVESEIEDENGTVAFEVEVLKDGQRHTVLVDTQSGEVLKTTMSDDEDSESDD